MTICYHRRVRNRVRNRKRTLEDSSRGGSLAAHVIASNYDLLTELLLLLPIISLLKFKSVCKQWLSLITDHHFIRRKNLKCNTISALYLDCYSRDNGVCHIEFLPLDSSFKSLKFPDYPHDLEIVQSCNGLLLFRGEEDEYFVYNPTTSQSKTLPPLPLVPPLRPGDEMELWGTHLAFDPSKSHFYKVVCILPSYHHGYQILIYSSETGRWRASGAPFALPLLVRYWTGVYCNHAIHWFSKSDASLYFDLNEELVREMPMPPPLYDYNDDDVMLDRYFGESRGHLHLVDSYKHLTTQLNIYEMERDRSGWFIKFRVDPDVLAMAHEGIRLMSVLYVVRGEKEEDSFLVAHTSNKKVIRYNFVSQTHQEICDMYSPPSMCIFPPAFQYIESLSFV